MQTNARAVANAATPHLSDNAASHSAVNPPRIADKDKTQTWFLPPQVEKIGSTLAENANPEANNTAAQNSPYYAKIATQPGIEQVLDKVLTKLEQLQEKKSDNKLPDGKYSQAISLQFPFIIIAIRWN